MYKGFVSNLAFVIQLRFLIVSNGRAYHAVAVRH